VTLSEVFTAPLLTYTRYTMLSHGHCQVWETKLFLTDPTEYEPFSPYTWRWKHSDSISHVSKNCRRWTICKITGQTNVKLYLHIMKTYEGLNTSSHIFLTPATDTDEMFIFTPLTLYLRGKRTRYTLTRTLGEPQNWSGRGEEELPCPRQQSNPESLAVMFNLTQDCHTYLDLASIFSRMIVSARPVGIPF
jgi:hypothetical protein